MQTYGDGTGSYMGNEADKTFSFDEESIRKGFIRKVYIILMGQLLITFGFVCIFSFSKAAKDWTTRNPALLWIALAIFIVTMICMVCCEGVRRKTPINFVFLFLFTLVESFLLGIIVGQYAADEVLMAVGITAIVSLGLTLFALQTKYDFTMCGGVLIACLVVFVVFGIIAIFIPDKVISLVYASLGAILFSIYLIYDTQLMLGGRHKYAISHEEYIFAALNLYLDIINIFMYILSVIGLVRN